MHRNRGSADMQQPFRSRRCRSFRRAPARRSGSSVPRTAARRCGRGARHGRSASKDRCLRRQGRSDGGRSPARRAAADCRPRARVSRGISHSPPIDGIEVEAHHRGAARLDPTVGCCRRISANASEVRRNSRWPSMVSATPRAPRSNTFSPSQRSSLAICRLTAPWVRLSFRPPPEKLPLRAATSKACRFRGRHRS